MALQSLIESLLFFKNEPTSIKKIATVVGKSEEEVEAALGELESVYASDASGSRGIRLVRNGKDVMLATAPESSELIEKVTKEELTRDLGKAGLEVLSIILYKSPVSRREIDYIRGVNSNFIIRNLLIRGLIEKTESKEGDRSFTYRPTFELLSFMGLTNVSELPEFETMQGELATVEETAKVEEAEQAETTAHSTSTEEVSVNEVNEQQTNEQ